MSEDRNPAARRPGLLVEDADAAIDTDPNTGRQTVVKTPDRPKQAERQGVEEHQI